MARKPAAAQAGRERASTSTVLPQMPSSTQNATMRDVQDEKAYFLGLYGTDKCPECLNPFSRQNSTGQPVQEGCCKHVKCRKCLISNQCGCIQCLQANNAIEPTQDCGRILRSSRTRSVGSYQPVSTPIAASNGLSNGYRQPSVLPPISYAPSTKGQGSPNTLPSTISSTACIGLGIGAALTNGLHQSSLPNPEPPSKKRSRRVEVVEPVKRPRMTEPFLVSGTPSDNTRSLQPELPLKKRHSPTQRSYSSEDTVSPTTPTVNGSSQPSPINSTNGVEEEDFQRSSSENGDTSSEIRSKKKRNPVTIYDHISILSGDPLLYKCGICMKKFKTKAHIKYHEFCQNGHKPFKCEECGQGFIAKSHFEYHIRTHTGERPYTCPKCGKGFNQRGKVTRHMRSHTGEKPFVCPTCGRGFANTQAMRSHLLIHTGERPFACEYCDKRFTGMTNLKKHVITHTGERPFMCTHCGKSFGLKWTLDLHLRTHSSERPYACDQCSRAFSNSKDLRRHMVIHSGERPFKCWICGTAFRRKDNLDRHIKNTHNQPKEVAKQLANEAAAEYLASSSTQRLTSSQQKSKSGGAEPGTQMSGVEENCKSTSSPSKVFTAKISAKKPKRNFCSSKTFKKGKRLSSLRQIREETTPPPEHCDDVSQKSDHIPPDDDEEILPTLTLIRDHDIDIQESNSSESLELVSEDESYLDELESHSSPPTLKAEIDEVQVTDPDIVDAWKMDVAEDIKSENDVPLHDEGDKEEDQGD